MKIAIIGTGYVGLISGVCFADKGHEVYIIDKDKGKISSIKKGISPIYEPGLDKLLVKNRKRIFPTTNMQEAVRCSQVIFIAVGTPFDGSKIDLNYVKKASTEIGAALRGKKEFTVVVVKSTVIPETTLNLVSPIILNESKLKEDNIGFCMNPEFLREGNAVQDFMDPDRVVLGVTSLKTQKVMRRLYARFNNAHILITTPTTAEMIKYTANSLLALMISYANEIARICETLINVNSEDVFSGVILDKRISPIISNKRIFPEIISYLRAGCGFGGSCFPKDVMALEAFARKRKVKSGILKALLDVNSTQISHIFNMGIISHSGKVRRIAVLGTAFKPETDDIRESPGIKIVQMALKRGIAVNVHDYIALENTNKLLKNHVKYFKKPLEAIRKCDIIFITTAWKEYLELSDADYEMNLAERALIVDCRSLFHSRARKSWRIQVGLSKSEEK